MGDRDNIYSLLESLLHLLKVLKALYRKIFNFLTKMARTLMYILRKMIIKVI